MISEKLLAVLIHDYQTLAASDKVSMSQYIAGRLQSIDTIKKQINDQHQAKMDADTEYQMAIKTVSVNMSTIRKTCLHEETRHHSDPSGGNDSWLECTICGGEVT